MVNALTNFIDQCMLCDSIYSIMGILPMIVRQLAPASRWGLSCAAQRPARLLVVTLSV